MVRPTTGSALARLPLTSHPATTVTGGAGAIGLRASGSVLARGGPDPDGPDPPRSDTHPPSVRVNVGELRGHHRLDPPATGQPHRQHGARLGEAPVHQREADRPAKGRG